MSYLFQNVNLLEDFPATVLVFDVRFVNRFYRYLFACELVDTKSYFSEGPLAKEFDKLIKIKSCLRYCVVLFDVSFDEFNKTSPVLRNGVI